MKGWLLSAMSVAVAVGVHATSRRELHEGWKFRQQNIREWMPATVPGTVHTDLLAHEIIPEPFYGDRQKDLQWIDKLNWEYLLHFDATEEAMQHVRLVFYGLDCFATVRLNNRTILKTDNMFRTWTADVKKVLQPKDNRLHVVFESPTIRGLQAMTAYGVPLRANNDLSVLSGFGAENKVSVFTRKSGYQYGWDLTPRYVPTGIWRPIVLEAWDDARIDDLYVYTQSIEAKKAQMGMKVTVDVATSGVYDIVLKLSDHEVKRVSHELKAGVNVVEEGFDIVSPKLWYPHGWGEPYLYTLSATVEKAGATLDFKEVQTGIRTVALRYEEDPDGNGRCFMLVVNGKPLFCKGSNYVPGDSFLPRIPKERIEHVVRSAAEANMNMLRVWGGGIYEEDWFYTLCDRYGIMVWQDFIFACNMYPGDEKFLANVQEEARDNVRRLRNHPCLMLWCGNNEIDVAWKPFHASESRFRKFYTPAQAGQFDRANEDIFMKILPAVVQEMYADNMPYWHSSPSPGWGLDQLDRWRYGDVHNWDIWHKGVPIEDYNKLIARFSSEYGLQSYPEVASIAQFIPEEERYMGSPSWKSHQGDAKADNRVRHYISEWYTLPAQPTLQQMAYLSQLMQAEGIRMAVEAHRRNMPYCMGSLIWQHNDTWPCASWSGVDFYGRWKAMHYFVAQSFSNLMLAPYLHGDTLDMHVVTDFYKPVKGVMELTLMDFSGNVLRLERKNITAAPATATKITTYSVAGLLAGHDKRKVVLVCDFRSGGINYRRLLYFDKVKHLALPLPKVHLEPITTPDGTYAVKVTTDVLAKNLVVLCDGVAGIFSDNYFDLLPGQVKTITLRPESTVQDFAKSLSSYTLVDIY